MVDEYIVDNEEEEEVTEEEVQEAIESAKTRTRSYLRDQLRKENVTKEDVKARRDELTLSDEDFGDGSDYIKVREYVDWIKANHNVPVSVVVRAFGGDRGMYEPLLPELQFFWHGRSRWFSVAAQQDHVVEALVTETEAKKAERAAKAQKKEEIDADKFSEATEEELKALTKAQLHGLYTARGGEDATFGNMKKADQINVLMAM